MFTALLCFPWACCGFGSSLSALWVSGMSQGKKGVGVREVLEFPWPGMFRNRAQRSRAAPPSPVTLPISPAPFWR